MAVSLARKSSTLILLLPLQPVTRQILRDSYQCPALCESWQVCMKGFTSHFTACPYSGKTWCMQTMFAHLLAMQRVLKGNLSAPGCFQNLPPIPTLSSCAISRAEIPASQVNCHGTASRHCKIHAGHEPWLLERTISRCIHAAEVSKATQNHCVM